MRRYTANDPLADFGSGYLVAPGLVLTAAHVVDDGSRRPYRLTVCQPDSSKAEFAARIVWQREDAAVDAALVEIDADSGWVPPQTHHDKHRWVPQRWGRLIGTRPLDVDVVGFPRMQKDPDTKERLDEHLLGRIVPGTGSLGGRQEVLSRDPSVPLPKPDDSSTTRWSGMSGAPVLAHDLLCGVIRQDRRADGGSRLTAIPAEALLADRQFCAVLKAHTAWTPLIEPAEPAPLLLPAAATRYLPSPAALLSADAESVDFYGRKEEITRLTAWCDEDAAFGVQIMTGSGGQGKTRLARKLAELRAADGWVTGQLRRLKHDTLSATELATLDTAQPLLLVVDYAETRPQTVRDLIDHFHTTRHHVRLLLIARADGPWRTDTLQATTTAVNTLASAPVLDLPTLDPPDAPDPRAAAFLRAAHDLAARAASVPALADTKWTRVATHLLPPNDLRGPRYASALALQMAALIALLEHGPAPAHATVTQSPEAALLTHEQAYWEGTAGPSSFDLGLRTPLLHRAAAVAAACGAANVEEAEATVRRIPGIPEGKARDVAEWLHALYPPGPDHYWASVQPDRLAEFHVSRELTHPDFPLQQLFRASSATQQDQLLNVLARAGVGHRESGRTDDYERTSDAIDSILPLDPQRFMSRATAAAALQLLADQRAQDAARHLAEQVASAEYYGYRQERAGQGDALIDLGFTIDTPGARSDPHNSYTLHRVVEAFTAARRPRRLVITGPRPQSSSDLDAGTGKTGMAVRLILGLLQERGRRDPVPVRLPATSWPHSDLHLWLTQQLTDVWQIRRFQAALLVDFGLVLPVIDGVDELPADRAAALLKAANTYATGLDDGELILTCRRPEYWAFVQSGHGLRNSMLLQLQPVDRQQAQAYLEHCSTTFPDPERWHPVLEALAAQGSVALEHALATPWCLELAVTVYEQRDRQGCYPLDPADLLIRAADGSLHRHLLEHYVEAAVASAPGWGPHNATSTTGQYLGVLASYLRHPATAAGATSPPADLALWNLWPLPGAHRVRQADRVLTAVLATAPVVMLPTLPGVTTDVPMVLVWTFPLTVLITLAVRGHPAPAPSRRIVRLPRSSAELRLLQTRLAESLTVGATLGLTQGAPIGAGLGIVFGLAEGLTSPVDRPVTDPHEPLRRDRRAWLAFGLYVGIAMGLGHAVITGTVSDAAAGFGAGLALGLTVALGTGFAGRASVRYLSFLLCARGLLPPKLQQFLQFCHRIGLLRIAGGVYQFRHREIQDHLARNHARESARTRSVGQLSR
ncbi:hypothetical protein IQ62_08465 [Streptomyces scabiei]|nr:hypothetical protein IQ62_08465 [Streptomyces scabiei]